MSRIILSRGTVDRKAAENYPTLPGALMLRLGGEGYKARMKDEGSHEAVERLAVELGPNYEPSWDMYVLLSNLDISQSKFRGKPAKVRIKRDGRDYVFVARDANNYYVEEAGDE